MIAGGGNTLGGWGVAVGVFVGPGVGVEVAVAVGSGVKVEVGLGVGVGVLVAVAVGVSMGVIVVGRALMDGWVEAGAALMTQWLVTTVNPRATTRDSASNKRFRSFCMIGAIIPQTQRVASMRGRSVSSRDIEKIPWKISEVLAISQE